MIDFFKVFLFYLLISASLKRLRYKNFVLSGIHIVCNLFWLLLMFNAVVIGNNLRCLENGLITGLIN